MLKLVSEKMQSRITHSFEDSFEEELSKEEEEKLTEVGVLGNSKNKTFQWKNILQTCLF